LNSKHNVIVAKRLAGNRPYRGVAGNFCVACYALKRTMRFRHDIKQETTTIGGRDQPPSQNFLIGFVKYHRTLWPNRGVVPPWLGKRLQNEYLFCVEWDVKPLCLQCFDAVGWAAGRACGL